MKNLCIASLLILAGLLYACASTKNTFSEGIDGKFEVQDMTGVCQRTGSADVDVQCLRVAAANSTRDKAFDLAKKYAVAAIMLRGVSGMHSPVKDPLIPLKDQDKNAGFIQKFFDTGGYLKYLDQAEIEPQEVYKIKGGYRVGVNAKVNHARLKQYLVENKIIRKFSL